MAGLMDNTLADWMAVLMENGWADSKAVHWVSLRAAWRVQKLVDMLVGLLG